MDSKQSADISFCEKAGISQACLLEGDNNIQHELPPELLVNGCVLEIYRLKPPWATFKSWLEVWLGKRMPEDGNVVRVRYFVKKLADQRTKLMRKKCPKSQHDLTVFENQPFEIPICHKRKSYPSSAPPVTSASSSIIATTCITTSPPSQMSYTPSTWTGKPLISLLPTRKAASNLQPVSPFPRNTTHLPSSSVLTASPISTTASISSSRFLPSPSPRFLTQSSSISTPISTTASISSSRFLPSPSPRFLTQSSSISTPISTTASISSSRFLPSPSPRFLTQSSSISTPISTTASISSSRFLPSPSPRFLTQSSSISTPISTTASISSSRFLPSPSPRFLTQSSSISTPISTTASISSSRFLPSPSPRFLTQSSSISTPISTTASTPSSSSRFLPSTFATERRQTSTTLEFPPHILPLVPRDHPTTEPTPVAFRRTKAAYTRMKKRLRATQSREKRLRQQKQVTEDDIRKQSNTIARLIANKRKQIFNRDEKLKKLKKIRLSYQDASVQTDMRYHNPDEEKSDILHDSEEEDNIFKIHRQISFFNGQKYDDGLVQCILSLLDNNVSTSRVSTVISAVLKLLNVTPEKLPCRSTVEEMGKLRLPLSHINIGETFADEEFTTLYTDETKKYGRQYESYILTSSQKDKKLLGVREISDKSAISNLETFKEILLDLDVTNNNEFGTVGDKILVNIKNTMSDRAATEKSFHNMLAEYRTAIIPDIISNWASLTPINKTKITKVHNFYCGLHLLVNAADKVTDSLAQFETKLKGSEPEGFDSGVINIIRISCKAFSRGGDEKNGVFLPSSTFLAARNIYDHLTNFKGNRFNIIFHNAGVLYFLQPHLLNFLQSCWGTPNKLLRAVLDGLQCDFNMSGCRALGILNKFLTQPLWKLIENEDNILSLSDIYGKIINRLRETPPESLLSGEAVLVPDSGTPTETQVFKALLKSGDNDSMTIAILEVLLTDLADLMEHLVRDQLPGGENSFASSTSPSNIECQSVLKHNKLPETIFGRLNYEQNRKPSASIFTHESLILYSFNRVHQWLEGLDEGRRRDVMKQASVLRRNTYETFKQRLSTIQRKRIESLKQKQEEKQLKEQRILKQKEQQTNEIVIHGLWQSEAEVKQKLNSYSTKTEKLKAVKIQLNFRKSVLKQLPSRKTLFSFSRNKKPLTIFELSQNLIQLIVEAGENKDFYPISELVGKRIEHFFEVGDEHIREGFKGRVISQVPGFPAWFNVVYDEEDDSVYTYKLMEDRQAGDLNILDEQQAGENPN